MASTLIRLRRDHPALMGYVALCGYSLGGWLLGGPAYLMQAPPPVVAALFVVGCILGFRASRSVLRRLHAPH